MTNATATARFLDRKTQVTDLLKPLVAGEAEWEATRDALVGLTYADVPTLTPDELMGRDGGEAAANKTPGDDPVEGSWPELVLAGDLGIITPEQVREVLGLIAGKGTAEPAPATDAETPAEDTTEPVEEPTA